MPTVLHACQNDRQSNWGKNSDYGEEIAICNPANTSVVLSYFLKDQPFLDVIVSTSNPGEIWRGDKFKITFVFYLSM